jgi:hypothetical protein
VSALRSARHHEAEAQLALARVLIQTDGAAAAPRAEQALERVAVLLEETRAAASLPELCVVRAALARAREDAETEAREVREAERLLRDLGAPLRAAPLAARLAALEALG